MWFYVLRKKPDVNSNVDLVELLVYLVLREPDPDDSPGDLHLRSLRLRLPHLQPGEQVPNLHLAKTTKIYIFKPLDRFTLIEIILSYILARFGNCFCQNAKKCVECSNFSRFIWNQLKNNVKRCKKKSKQIQNYRTFAKMRK